MLAKKYASLAGNKPICFLEVIADTEKEIINQAKILSTISDNVHVKVPVMLTTGETTYELIENSKLTKNTNKRDCYINYGSNTEIGSNCKRYK